MRIPSGVTDQVIYFKAVDSTDFVTPETGLSSFTVYRSRNGGTATAMTTPTVTEVDATNMPGIYKLLLDEDMTIDSGDDSQEMIFFITQASMAPVARTIELYRPKITAGDTLSTADIASILADTAELQTDDYPTTLAAISAAIAALNDISVSDVLTTQMTESYAANGVAPTLAQAIFAIHQHAMQFGISGTSLTVRKLDDSTTAFVVTLDSASAPTDASRV